MTSSDETAIGDDRLSDKGPLIVLVSGGLEDGFESLASGEHLAGAFTVVAYRRRGRDSGDPPPHAVEREIDDLAAVNSATGGRAHLFAASSGGALAFHKGSA